MSAYILRLRDGDCMIVEAASEDYARRSADPLAGSEVCTLKKSDTPRGLHAACNLANSFYHFATCVNCRL